MSVMEEGPWEDPAQFQNWIEDTTGWDGKTFSLSEDERFWIAGANELIEWLRLSAAEPATSQEALQAAFRCLMNLPPMPGSLTVS